MRALKVLVVVMGVLIVVATVGLVAVLVQRISAAGGNTTMSRIEGSLQQPEGTRVLGIAGAGDRLSVWVSRSDGDHILLVDPRSGRTLGDLRVTP
ncbi:DUF6476 family protein [Roseomonas elaeocarpi]|uniref:DUF6476 family protein n=1 Tax=Roseomonas elaeocarpi TaxID=907779 RepID=A0ABV6JR74_9PROT